jgi:hypothetical protein
MTLQLMYSLWPERHGRETVWLWEVVWTDGDNDVVVASGIDATQRAARQRIRAAKHKAIEAGPGESVEE